MLFYIYMGACGSVIGWGTMLQAGSLSVRVLDEGDFFNLPNPSSRAMALGSIQPLAEMSTRNIPGGKKWRIGLTTLPPSVSRMSENVGTSTSHNPKGLPGLYRDNFTFICIHTHTHTGPCAHARTHPPPPVVFVPLHTDKWISGQLWWNS
jgi:hypothetical protein